MRKPATIVAIVVVILILVAALARFNINSYRPQIQIQLAEKLNRNVTLVNVSLRLFPLRVRVENPIIADDPAFQTQSPFVRAEMLDVSVRLLPLLRGNIEIAALNLQRPAVELVRNAQGIWNFSTLGHSTSSNGNTLSIGAMAIKDGQVAVTDLQQKQPRAIYNHIDLRLKDYAPGKPFSIDASAHLSGSGAEELHLAGTAGPVPESNPAMAPFNGTVDLKEVSVGSLEKFAGNTALFKMEGIVSGDTKVKSSSGTLAATGHLNIDKPLVNGVDIGYPITTDYNLSDNLAEDRITINPATVKLGQTPLTIDGSIDVRSRPTQLELNMKSGDVPIAEIARLASAFGVAFAPGTTVAGRVAANVQFRGAADRPALHGTLTARDLKISGKDIHQPISVPELDVEMTPSEIHSNDFAVTTANTAVSARFALRDYTSRAPIIEATLRAPNATLSEVLAIAKVYGATSVDKIRGGSGTLSLDLHAGGPLRQISSQEILRTLNGNVNLDLKDVRIAGTNIKRELGSIADFLKPAHSNEDYTDISRATGHIVIKNGVAETNDLKAQLDVTTLSARGTADLPTERIETHATAVFGKASADQVGGTSIGGYLKTALANNQGELVIPVIITGTFNNPHFAPDAQQLAQMKLKGLLPTSSNPASAVSGVLGSIVGRKGAGQSQPSGQNPANPVNQIFGNILGGKKK